MSNKFAAALKPENRQDSQPSKKSQTIATKNKLPSARQGAKHIGGYFDPIVSRQLKTIAVDEDSSVQVLLGEALDMLFQSRGKPMIASKDIR